MGVSSVFTLLLCGKLTFPWAVAFVSATMGLTTFSHRYCHPQCPHLLSLALKPILFLDLNVVFPKGQYVSFVFCFVCSLWVIPFVAITYISIVILTAPRSSLLDIQYTVIKVCIGRHIFFYFTHTNVAY